MHHYKETNEFLKASTFFYTIAIGMDSCYSYVSDSYNRNFDLLNESLLGKHFSVTLHPDDISVCAEVGMKCFENPDQLFSATLRKHNGLGGFVFTQWEMKAMFDKNGNPEGIFCIGYNITEYVETRTELVTAKTEIEEKNNQLTEIGFMQSHVIRKPLANIIGLAQIIGEIDSPEEIKEIKDLLIESTKELDDVIKNITDKTD